MAKIVENEKNFKVIEVSGEECRDKIGGLGICDWCNEAFDKAYYVAVLNYCYCPKCYDNWLLRAVSYPEDKNFETRMFEAMKETLELNKEN